MSRRYSEIQSRYKKETGNNADKGMAYDIWIENRKWIINISDNDAIRLNGMINNNDYMGLRQIIVGIDLKRDKEWFLKVK